MLAYLLELRQRSIKIMALFVILFLIFFYFANTLFTFITKPLLTVLPSNNGFIATEITTAILTPLQLAADFAIIVTLPFALSQIWAYVAPALYRKERSKLRSLVIASFVLFCLGLVFCFYAILPMLFQFFIGALPAQVRMMPEMGHILDFITRMLVLFGLCFQLPLICFALVSFAWVDLSVLKKIRPYVIVAAFIIGMILTPPDVFSQILLAVPLCILYELGIFFCRFIKPSLTRPQQKD